MKTLLLCLLLLPAVPVLAQMQPPAPTQAELGATGKEMPAPFRGANTIVLTTPDSAAVVYIAVGRALLAAGYSLDKTDKELGFISTKSRPAPRYNMMYSCTVSIRPTGHGSKVSISGVYTLPGAAAVSAIMAGETAIEYRGGPNATFMICWNAMHQAVSQAYPKAAASYSRR